MEPHVKSLHLTLAYRFEPSDTETLKTLIQDSVDIKSASTYELRLYSRDPRVASKQVYKVHQSFNSHESDELELREGDLICVSEEGMKNVSDGWVEGLSLNTGTNGLFPLSLVTRVSESDAWTLHCKIQVCNPSMAGSHEPKQLSLRREVRMVNNTAMAAGNGTNENNKTTEKQNESSSTGSANGSNSKKKPSVDEEVNAGNLHLYIARIIVWDTNNGTYVDAPNQNQKLFVLRHGERVDFTFANWTDNCINAGGQYRRMDLNMPKTLPVRSNPKIQWKHDTPLTSMGMHQAWLIGDMLREVQCPIDVVYTSPSFRCIQTCHSLLEGMNLHREVNLI